MFCPSMFALLAMPPPAFAGLCALVPGIVEAGAPCRKAARGASPGAHPLPGRRSLSAVAFAMKTPSFNCIP